MANALELTLGDVDMETAGVCLTDFIQKESEEPGHEWDIIVLSPQAYYAISAFVYEYQTGEPWNEQACVSEISGMPIAVRERWRGLRYQFVNSSEVLE